MQLQLNLYCSAVQNMYFYSDCNMQDNSLIFCPGSSYYTSTQNLSFLYEQIQNSRKIIDQLKKQNDQLKNELERIRQSQSRISMIPIQQIKKPNKYYKKIKNQNGEILQRQYSCPFDQCIKVYGSNLALDLHIRKKHDGGTRKQRQAYAKMIVLAQMRNQEAPNIKFNFPPGYIEKFRQKYTNRMLCKQKQDSNEI